MKGQLFQKLLQFAAKNKDVARDALVSGGLNTGLSLLSGADLGTALKYGAADVAASYPATLAVKEAAPWYDENGTRSQNQKNGRGKSTF